MNKNKKNLRVLFVGNSQATAAGLSDKEFWFDYPHLVQAALPETNCIYWTTSDNSVEIVDNLFKEIVKQHHPKVVIFHFGIIEAGLRILPKQLKTVLKLTSFGRKILEFLHRKRKYLFRFLNSLGINFVEVSKKNYESHLKTIIDKCRASKIKPILMKTPLLCDQTEKEVLPGNNRVLSKYNEKLGVLAKIYRLPIIDGFVGNDDLTGNTLYLKNTVHFSLRGHQLIATNIINFLKS